MRHLCASPEVLPDVRVPIAPGRAARCGERGAGGTAYCRRAEADRTGEGADGAVGGTRRASAPEGALRRGTRVGDRRESREQPETCRVERRDGRCGAVDPTDVPGPNPLK